MNLTEQKLLNINDKIDIFMKFKIDLGDIYEKYKKISFEIMLSDIQEDDNYVKELDEIEKELSKYDQLLNTLNTFNEIYKKTSFYRIKDEDIKSIIKQIIDNSSNIIHSGKNQDNIEKQLLNKIYKIIYEIMKLEIIHVNETNLFDYFSDKDLIKQFLNELIKEDLIKIKNKFGILEEDEYDDEYSLKVLSINIDNLDDCYSLENLKLILRYDGRNYLYKIDIYNKFKNLLSRHEDINNRDGIREDNIKYNEENLESLKTDLNKNKKNIHIRVGSIILTLGIMTGIFAFNNGKLKKACTDKVYKGTETSYSTDYGVKERPIELEVSSNPTDNVKINVYSKVFDNKRTVSTYDISDIKLSDIKDYLDINLDDIYYDISLTHYDENTPDFEYSEVVITDINNKEIYTNFDYDDYYSLLFFLTLLTEILVDLISIICQYFFENKISLGVIHNLFKIFGKTKVNPSLYDQYKNNINEIKKIINNIEILKQEIDTLEIRDKEVKEEFDKVYQQYSYLLTEANLFLNRFEIIDEQNDNKKLVRRKDN